MLMSRILDKFVDGFVRRRQAKKAAPQYRRTVGLLLMLVMALQPLSCAAEPDAAPGGKNDHYYEPLPEETGTAGLKLMLRRLQTTGRLMQVTAHPDDEDGGMLTLESRGKGVSALLMTLTRGEGGQNKLGSNLFDVLGVLRTLELLASDRYYGVEQRFSRVADFGYSKTPEETFQKWHGHEVALGDMVRVIRTFRPDVLVARFSGTDRDGHGHHQASALLTREAFRAAGDPKRFPEQLAEGLQPWQPKKLYTGNVCGFFSNTCDAANYTVRLNTGVKDPVLGTSYIQFAMQGLRHQLSQGAANWTIDDGDRFTHYKLLDAVVDSSKDKDGHEQDLFDGIDTSLPGLAARLGEEEKKVPWLRGELTTIQQLVSKALQNAETDSSKTAADLFTGRKSTEELLHRVQQSSLSESAKRVFFAAMGGKSGQFQQAANLALGVELRAMLDTPPAAFPETAPMVVPGRAFDVAAKVRIAGQSGLDNLRVRLLLETPACPMAAMGTGAQSVGSGGEVEFKFHLTPCEQASYTRPYWHREDPERDSLNTIDQAQYLTLPFAPPPIRVHLDYEWQGFSGNVEVPAMVRFRQADGSEGEHPLAIGPAFSVEVQPSGAVIPTGQSGSTGVKTSARDQGRDSEAQVSVRVPNGWRSEPSHEAIKIATDQAQEASFQVFPSELKEGRAAIRAHLKSGVRGYDEGYSVVTREDLGSAYYYQPAVQRVSIVDVKIPRGLKVGYIMGAGDEIPTVLQQIGMDVTLIPADKLATEDLGKYQTIVLGIRAYDTQKDVIASNKRLLAFVEAGGRLVVQYNASASDFNSGKFTPYPATLSRARASVEEAPVAILDPANRIFHSPNQITQKDFEGWVQERGLYFMSQWDPKFTPLLETHDPGESEQKGGLLVAQYGKGMYIYTGYAFFRQLPAGVPGAVRLFVNLVSRE